MQQIFEATGNQPEGATDDYEDWRERFIWIHSMISGDNVKLTIGNGT